MRVAIFLEYTRQFTFNNSLPLSLSLSLPLEYKEKHGDCNVPQKYADNPPLGRWVDNQKTQHKKLYDGKSTHLTIERIQHLVSVGFDFRPNKKEKNKD